MTSKLVEKIKGRHAAIGINRSNTSPSISETNAKTNNT